MFGTMAGISLQFVNGWTNERLFGAFIYPRVTNGVRYIYPMQRRLTTPACQCTRAVRCTLTSSAMKSRCVEYILYSAWIGYWPRCQFFRQLPCPPALLIDVHWKAIRLISVRRRCRLSARQ